jgi:cytochrome bd-type quinol oxidase subunit 2
MHTDTRLWFCKSTRHTARQQAWLQHRAQTLAIWMMFVMTFPTFVDTSMFAVKSSHNTTALWVVSGLALAANVAVLGYEIYKIVKTKRNPLKEEIYTELDAYKQVASLR